MPTWNSLGMKTPVNTQRVLSYIRISTYHLVRDKTLEATLPREMRRDSHATEWNIILCKPDKMWVLKLDVDPNYSCFKADPTALQSTFFFFSFPLDKALTVEVRMRMNRPPHQSAARSNLVGSPASSWLVKWPKEARPKPISQIPGVQPDPGGGWVRAIPLSTHFFFLSII